MKVYVGRRGNRGNRLHLICILDSGRRRTKLLPENTTEKQAIREAALWESELRQAESEYVPGSWDEFKNRFFVEYIESRSHRMMFTMQSAFRRYETLMKPSSPNTINTSKLSQFSAALQQDGLSPQTIVTYLKHLRVALRWGARIGLVEKVPRIEMPRTHIKTEKGRALTEYEVKRMMVACKRIDKPNALMWQRLIWGLYLSGLRLGEILRLSWDSPPVLLDLDSQYPRIIWSAEGHKSRRDEISPITPDFAQFLRSLPGRTGRVFGCSWSTPYCGRIISRSGRKARIYSGKAHATAHDLRRTFATRLALKVKPVALKAIMRHSDIKTTLSYYVGITSDDVGAELASVFGVTNGVTNEVSTDNSGETRLRIAR